MGTNAITTNFDHGLPKRKHVCDLVIVTLLASAALEEPSTWLLIETKHGIDGNAKEVQKDIHIMISRIVKRLHFCYRARAMIPYAP